MFLSRFFFHHYHILSQDIIVTSWNVIVTLTDPGLSWDIMPQPQHIPWQSIQEYLCNSGSPGTILGHHSNSDSPETTPGCQSNSRDYNGSNIDPMQIYLVSV